MYVDNKLILPLGMILNVQYICHAHQILMYKYFVIVLPQWRHEIAVRYFNLLITHESELEDPIKKKIIFIVHREMRTTINIHVKLFSNQWILSKKLKCNNFYSSLEFEHIIILFIIHQTDVHVHNPANNLLVYELKSN